MLTQSNSGKSPLAEDACNVMEVAPLPPKHAKLETLPPLAPDADVEATAAWIEVVVSGGADIANAARANGVNAARLVAIRDKEELKQVLGGKLGPRLRLFDWLTRLRAARATEVAAADGSGSGTDGVGSRTAQAGGGGCGGGTSVVDLDAGEARSIVVARDDATAGSRAAAPSARRALDVEQMARSLDLDEEANNEVRPRCRRAAAPLPRARAPHAQLVHERTARSTPAHARPSQVYAEANALGYAKWVTNKVAATFFGAAFQGLPDAQQWAPLAVRAQRQKELVELTAKLQLPTCSIVIVGNTGERSRAAAQPEPHSGRTRHSSSPLTHRHPPPLHSSHSPPRRRGQEHAAQRADRRARRPPRLRRARVHRLRCRALARE